MTIPYPNMPAVAKAAGVPYCHGLVNGQYCGDIRTSRADHQRGFVRDGTVHLADRRVTRPAIRMLALLAADVVIGPTDDMPSWKARWLRCSIAEEICRTKLHVRIPSAYWNLDRWTVRAQLAHVDPGTPQRAEALAWTRLAP